MYFLAHLDFPRIYAVLESSETGKRIPARPPAPIGLPLLFESIDEDRGIKPERLHGVVQSHHVRGPLPVPLTETIQE